MATVQSGDVLLPLCAHVTQYIIWMTRDTMSKTDSWTTKTHAMISIVAKFGNQKTGTGLEHSQKLVDHAPFATTPINATPSLEVKVCGGCGKNNVACRHLTKSVLG